MQAIPRTSGAIAVLELSGQFDAYTAPAVSQWITASLPATAQAVVNLRGVTFVDSTALATLVQGMKHCRQRAGDLRLCALQAPVRSVFELTRLDRAFVILPDEATALRSFNA